MFLGLPDPLVRGTDPDFCLMIEGSESGPVSQRYRFADSDPDPYQNDTGPQHFNVINFHEINFSIMLNKSIKR